MGKGEQYREWDSHEDGLASQIQYIQGKPTYAVDWDSDSIESY